MIICPHSFDLNVQECPSSHPWVCELAFAVGPVHTIRPPPPCPPPPPHTNNEFSNRCAHSSPPGIFTRWESWSRSVSPSQQLLRVALLSVKLAPSDSDLASKCALPESSRAPGGVAPAPAASLRALATPPLSFKEVLHRWGSSFFTLLGRCSCDQGEKDLRRADESHLLIPRRNNAQTLTGWHAAPALFPLSGCFEFFFFG